MPRPPGSSDRTSRGAHSAARSARGPRGAGADARLASYRAKRDAARTPEPSGDGDDQPPAAREGAHLFAVQQHDARRMHFDLRLAWRGVLLSWAVPKGPSLDPADKRLAIRVEDHPVGYADFEGVIPSGAYGAGPVIVWDRGAWVPREDVEAGLAAGKLLFDLHGYKLRGRFALVRTGRRNAPSNDWLLLKKPDRFADPEAELPAVSVLSGLTVRERAAGGGREAALLAGLERAGAPRRRVSVATVRPMLATAWPRAFSDPAWRFELKYDGYRMIAARDAGAARLLTRNGRDATARFPEVAAALAALPVEHLVLDGELVVLDARGRPRFARLQQRAQARGTRDAARAALTDPATLFVFDLLAAGGRDARPLALGARRALLEPLVPRLGPLRLADQWTARGEAVFAEIERLDLEGMMAKRADAPYRAGRHPAWRKVARHRSGDFAIVGWRAGRGARTPLGALHLAARDDDAGLVYVGRVGSGLDEGALAGLRDTLSRLRRDTPAFREAPPATRGDHWVEPELSCEVRYAERTRDGRLRQPVFVRLRPDKGPDEVESIRDAGPAAAALAPRVARTHTDKIFWPDAGITKGELLDYYEAISPWLLPWLRDRPLVVVRHPDGIAGKAFFQKAAPESVPDWIRTAALRSRSADRTARAFVCDDVDTLLYVANLGAIPLHIGAARLARPERPDWCVLDLDPKGAPFPHVVAVARALLELGREIDLPLYAKTSGSEGLHLLVPLGGRLDFAQARTLADLLAQVVVARLPDLATRTRARRARRGRVYVDTGQNGAGKLLVAPFAVRALPGAPVSMPLRPGEIARRLDPRRFTLRNALRRMQRLGEDPLAPVLGDAPDLPGALERLAARLRGARAR